MTEHSSTLSNRAWLLVDLGWYGAAMALIVGIGALNLYIPFVGDQSILLLGAKVMNQGGVLYLDFWDNKMPGLFWFFQAGSRLFGPSEVGIHLFELGYLAAFSVLLMWVMRDELPLPWLSSLAPVAVVGVYYAAAVPTDLTTLEMLAGVPIFVSLWCASRCRADNPHTVRYAVASGLFAGVAVTFKLIFAPVFMAAWLAIGIHVWAGLGPERTAKERAVQLVRRGLVPITLGVVAVLGLVVFKFWRDGALSQLLWTAFDYPFQALQHSPPAPLPRLVESVMFLVSFYFVWGGFVLVALVHWWRTERSPLVTVLLIWIIAMVPLLLVQRFSWWQYHFMNLFTPVGLLGIKGLAVVLSWVVGEQPVRSARTMLLCALLAMPAVGALAIPARDKIMPFIFTFWRHDGSVLDYQALFRPNYKRMFKSTNFLRRRGAMPGPIYVFGDPTYFHFAKRPSKVPIPGFSWRFFANSQWDELLGQLKAASVPYIYINSDAGSVIAAQRPKLWAYVSENYRALTSDHDGVWFRRLRAPE